MRYYDASGVDGLPVPIEWIEQIVNGLREEVDDLVIIGATARDLLASHAGKVPTTRVTKDLDVAIAVSDMGQYRVATARFDPRHSAPQFVCEGHLLDIIPYGAVEQDRHVIFASDHRLDVTGLAEAASSKVHVTLRPGLVVPVASLEAQSVLKILAWRDRRYDTRDKDAEDLTLLLEASSQGIYADLVWDDLGALEATYFDVREAGAHRLGRRAAALFDSQPRDSIARLVSDDEFRRQLTRAMNAPTTRRLLKAYAEGFLGALLT